MSFLPLAAARSQEEYGAMHPYAVEEMVEERRAELQRQRHADEGGFRDGIPGWRRRAGRALASLAVAVPVPPPALATSLRIFSGDRFTVGTFPSPVSASLMAGKLLPGGIRGSGGRLRVRRRPPPALHRAVSATPLAYRRAFRP